MSLRWRARIDSVAEQGSAGSLAVIGYGDAAHDVSRVGAEIAKRLGKILARS